MKKGDTVFTPRFCTVRIAEVFDSLEEAAKEGFKEPTHYDNSEYDILGNSIGTNKMIFAAVKK